MSTSFSQQNLKRKATGLNLKFAHFQRLQVRRVLTERNMRNADSLHNYFSEWRKYTRFKFYILSLTSNLVSSYCNCEQCSVYSFADNICNSEKLVK